MVQCRSQAVALIVSVLALKTCAWMLILNPGPSFRWNAAFVLAAGTAAASSMLGLWPMVQRGAIRNFAVAYLAGHARGVAEQVDDGPTLTVVR